MLLESHPVVQIYKDDVSSKVKVIADDMDLKNSPGKLEKLENIREKNTTIGQHLNLMNDDEFNMKRGKNEETLLARIPMPLLHFHIE